MGGLRSYVLLHHESSKINRLTKRPSGLYFITMNDNKQTELKQAWLTLHDLRQEQPTSHRLTRTALQMAMDIVQENIDL